MKRWALGKRSRSDATGVEWGEGCAQGGKPGRARIRHQQNSKQQGISVAESNNDPQGEHVQLRVPRSRLVEVHHMWYTSFRTQNLR